MSLPSASQCVASCIVEQAFRTTAMNLPIVAWFCRADQGPSHFSKAWILYTGCGSEIGDWRTYIHPEDVELVADLLRDFGSDEWPQPVVRIVGQDGRYRWHRVMCSSVTETETPAWILVASDVQDMRDAIDDIAHREQERINSERRFRMACEAGRVGIFEIDLGLRTVTWEEMTARIFGIPLDEFDGRLETMRSVIVAEDRQRVERTLSAATSKHLPTLVIDYRIVRPDGEMRHIRSSVSMHYVGGTVRVIGGVFDLTDERVDEDQKNVLLAELTHRVMNNLSTVQSIASQTAPRDGGFCDLFLGRLHGMSSVQSLLISRSWIDVPLDAVIDTALALDHDSLGTDFAHSGPMVLMNPSAGVNIGLIIHELVSNARRWGGLSRSGGRLRVEWETIDCDDDEILRFRWDETGGPDVVAPNRRDWGFGFRLLTAFSRQLGGTFTPRFSGSSFQASLEIPMKTIVAKPGTSLMRP